MDREYKVVTPLADDVFAQTQIARLREIRLAATNLIKNKRDLALSLSQKWETVVDFKKNKAIVLGFIEASLSDDDRAITALCHEYHRIQIVPQEVEDAREKRKTIRKRVLRIFKAVIKIVYPDGPVKEPLMVFTDDLTAVMADYYQLYDDEAEFDPTDMFDPEDYEEDLPSSETVVPLIAKPFTAKPIVVYRLSSEDPQPAMDVVAPAGNTAGNLFQLIEEEEDVSSEVTEVTGFGPSSAAYARTASPGRTPAAFTRSQGIINDNGEQVNQDIVTYSKVKDEFPFEHAWYTGPVSVFAVNSLKDHFSSGRSFAVVINPEKIINLKLYQGRFDLVIYDGLLILIGKEVKKDKDGNPITFDRTKAIGKFHFV
jgi:hypothetical protein